MQVRLAYGSTGLLVKLPADRTTVIAPRRRDAAADPRAEITRALREPVHGPPLRDLVRRGQSIAISVCDITRPQPRRVMIEAILEELDGTARAADVTVLVATGTHRRNTPGELASMLGPDVVGSCQVVNHDSRDRSALVDLGMSGDVPVHLSRDWVDADVRITTGFVEPHFFAGFSGGPKMVAPGLAGLQTVLALHNAQRIADPKATWGICEGNPVHDAIRAVAAMSPPDFAIDVLLNDRQQVTRAFGGALTEMHLAARKAARGDAMRRVRDRYDLVITTNSGYPLDQNLYQSVKGMSAAAEVVRDGGTIVCAAECRDGFPDHGSYRELLGSARTIEAVAAGILASGETIPDQWQVQIQARVQRRARVIVHTDGLTAGDLAAAHLEWTDSIEATVERVLREQPDARICVLPEGPRTIPYVA
jgi:nickel-dependent lactate racemase